MCLTIICLNQINHDNRDRGVDQPDKVDETRYSQDPLHGIGGPMTRARTKRMKNALQGLILQVQDKEAALENSKTKFEGFIATRSMVTYLVAEGIDSKDLNEGMS